jgi:hypothetical protein
MVMNTTETWLIAIANFYSRFANYESRNMITSMNKWWNFRKHVSKHNSCLGIL